MQGALEQIRLAENTRLSEKIRDPNLEDPQDLAMFPHLNGAPGPAKLAETFFRIDWQRCQNCGKDWSALPDSGICPDCEEYQERADRVQGVNGELLRKCIGRYGVEHYAFQNFKVETGNTQAYHACLDFKPEQGNLFIYGPCGLGKTHLAGAVLKRFMGSWSEDYAPRAALIHPPYLFRHMRGLTAQEENDRMEWWASCILLIIDDLGVGKATDFSLQILYEIINQRFKNKRNGMIITSNLTLDRLAKTFGDDRLPSRIAGMCRVVAMVGEDQRLNLQIRSRSQEPAPPVESKPREPESFLF